MENLYIKIGPLIGLIPIIISCGSLSSMTSGQPTNPSEVRRWYPPTQQELLERRERQRVLDNLEWEIEQRFLFQEDLKGEEKALLASLRVNKNQISGLDPAVRKKIDNFKKHFIEIQTQLAMLEKTGTDIKTGIADYKKTLIPIRRTADNYVSAIRWFQKGRYSKSITAFQKMLIQKPPRFLQDNIYFGLGTAFYKLKKWDSAVKQFNKVVNEYPMGNKWPVSHLMLGLIYNMRNEKSRALYILENALDKHLPNSTRRLIERLLKSIQESEADVSS